MTKILIAFNSPPQSNSYMPYITNEIVEMIEKKSFSLVPDTDLEDKYIREQIQGVIVYPFACDWLFKYINQLPNLKLITSIGTGYDHLRQFDVLKGVQFGCCPSLWPTSVADHGMALLLSSARRVLQGTKLTMGSEMPDKLDYIFTKPVARDVSGSTLGIIGMGEIGLEIAKRAYNGFGMKILYHNRRQKTVEEKLYDATFYDNLLAMLPHCDFVMIACNLSPETQNMFSTEAFQAMKPTAHLINIARGGIVDHDALVQALESGSIDGAALDVTFPEPLPREHPLLKLPNVIITPHRGWNTTSATYNMWKSTLDNLVACLIDNTTMPGEVTLD